MQKLIISMFAKTLSFHSFTWASWGWSKLFCWFYFNYFGDKTENYKNYIIWEKETLWHYNDSDSSAERQICHSVHSWILVLNILSQYLEYSGKIKTWHNFLRFPKQNQTRLQRWKVKIHQTTYFIFSLSLRHIWSVTMHDNKELNPRHNTIPPWLIKDEIQMSIQRRY